MIPRRTHRDIYSWHLAQHRRRGAALVVILAVIALLAALVVGFLSRVGAEVQASNNYSAGAHAQLLADTAINLVQASINEATTAEQGSTWASQPGAIRTFDDTGALTAIHRLYSAPSLTTATSDGSELAADVPPDQWWKRPALWVDLNAPIVTRNDAGQDLIFPILDPRDPTNPGSIDSPNVLSSLDGFSIEDDAPIEDSADGSPPRQPAPMPVRWLYVLRNGDIVPPVQGGDDDVVNVPGATEENPIVGRIAYWADDETAKVNINTAAGSAALWNGEKIPGTWDTPRFKMWMERMLFSENQPVQGEYQRYPGHPATTDLYNIFDALGVSLPNYPYTVTDTGASPQPGPDTNGTDLYEMLPRYTDGNSSRAGSRNSTKISTPPVINNGVAKKDRLYSSVGEMLYEPERQSGFLDRQQLETGKFFLTAHSRAPEITLFGTPRIGIWPIHRDSGDTTRTSFDNLIAFCSTIGGDQSYYIQRADSRSATSDYDDIERNQEIYDYLQYLTSRRIPGFNGTFADKYSHSSGGSNERDQILTEIIDYIRCTNLFDHSKPKSDSSFERFTDNPADISPGKYNFRSQVTPLVIKKDGITTRGLGRIQTISEIGILLICTADGNSPLGAYQPPVLIGGKKVSPVDGSGNDPLYASNLPEAQYLRHNNGNILGWDSEAMEVQQIDSADMSTTSYEPFPANPTLTIDGEYHGSAADPSKPDESMLAALSPGQKKVQAMLLFELACPMQGNDPLSTSSTPAYKIKATGLNGIAFGTHNPFPERNSTADELSANLNGDGFLDNLPRRTSVYGTGGIMGFRYLISERSDRYNGWSGRNPYTSGNSPYRYVSNPFTLTGSSTPLYGGFTAELHIPTSTTDSQAYQTIQVEFPRITGLPAPDLPVHGITGSSTSGNAFPPNAPAEWWGFDYRIARASAARDGYSSGKAVTGPAGVIRADVPLDSVWNWGTRGPVYLPTFANQNDSTFSGSDVVRTLVAKDGDYRLVAAKGNILADATPHSPFVEGPGYYADNMKLGHLFRDQGSAFNTAGTDVGGELVQAANYASRYTPKVPSSMTGTKKRGWDWDTGLVHEADGAYAGKPDEGNIYVNSQSPYYNREQQGNLDDISSYFTANRIVSSPVMFGSLPTGVVENVSWRTLLFRPQADRPDDPAGPPDHLLLDLFSMPVVEPYAISEPFSTAGKVNMNYQIVPFTYINRSTGMRAVLGSELMARVPKAAAEKVPWSTPEQVRYKGTPGNDTPQSAGGTTVTRLPLNLDETRGSLRQFEEKFGNWEIFKSASEICDIYLTPKGYEWSNNSEADAAWYGDDFALVGDNVRERPYSNIYPRLTTKSNTFKVHYLVEVLKNPPNNPPDEWDETRGTVEGALRGSTILERYLDPNNQQIPDYAADPDYLSDPDAETLDTFYRWRVISNEIFSS